MQVWTEFICVSMGMGAALSEQISKLFKFYKTEDVMD
jgi:hypothetical protein